MKKKSELRYIQGKFVPKNVNKYKGNPNQIFFRSLWEYHLFRWLDGSSDVEEWGSETVVIPYFNLLDKKIHRYFVDIYAKIRDKDGVIRKYLVEVKPYKETIRPKDVRMVPKYITNMSKWKAAEEFAKKNGMRFILLTEKELYGK